MNLPEKYEVLIITLSDRAFSGAYDDLSGPRIKKKLGEYFAQENVDSNINLALIPDDAGMLRELVKKASDTCNFIFTTGGTGIGPRDITVETILPLMDKQIPGIMEFIRVKYGTANPAALLSRGIAGVIGKALVYTLPGSLKAVDEYMNEILRTLSHTLQMQYGIDTHPKH
jgi:molybdenum cofactor synthesis domain-containing protein